MEMVLPQFNSQRLLAHNSTSQQLAGRSSQSIVLEWVHKSHTDQWLHFDSSKLHMEMVLIQQCKHECLVHKNRE